MRSLCRVIPTPAVLRSAQSCSARTNHNNCYVPQPILERAELVRRRRATAPSAVEFHEKTTEPLLRTAELREAASNIRVITGVPEEILELFYRATPVSTGNLPAAEFKAWWHAIDMQNGIMPSNAGLQLYNGMLHSCSQRRHWERTILSWSSVRRGSDCFVPGLPRFSIQQAQMDAIKKRTVRQWYEVGEYPHPLDSAMIRQLEQDNLHKSMDMHPLGWILRPIDLQVFGHFPSGAEPPPVRFGTSAHWFLHQIVSAPATSPARQNLIRFHSWWNLNPNALDVSP